MSSKFFYVTYITGYFLAFEVNLVNAREFYLAIFIISSLD